MTSISWQYPIYLLPHGGGYVSIVDDASDDAQQMLAVYSTLDLAHAFRTQFEILGTPRALHNDREFGWLLQSLREPVTQVAFDPCVSEREINSRWRASVQDLLKKHLAADKSPWNYPIFAVAQDAGFLSIAGQSQDGRKMTAIGLFTAADKATDFLQAAGETGELCELPNLNQTRAFIESLADDVLAVALNPIATNDHRSAKHCFAIATLLEKYLVRGA